MLQNPSPDLNLLRRQSYYHQPYPNQPYRNPTPAPEQYGFYGYGSHPNAFQDYTSQHSSFPFSHQDYVSQTQMGGSSSQPRTYPPKSPINAFSIEELYTPEFLESLQENIDYWQAPNTYEAAGEQVVTSSTKNRKKATHNRQTSMIENDDAPRHTLWTTKEEVELAKGWLAISENSKDGYVKKKLGFWCEVLEYIESKTKQYGHRTYNAVLGKWKTMHSSRKHKGSKPTGSSTLNEDKMARVDGNWDDSSGEEERLAFLEIKRRDVECREQEIEQQDMRFYLQPNDHLTGDQQNAVEEIRAKIKAKYNLQY
nr:hypothetical protein [Tanacetum cinerariifolium]